LSKQKCLFYFFYKTGEQESETDPAWGFGSSGRGEDVGKGCRRVNMVQTLCTQVCKCENETRWNYSRNGREEHKGEWWRGVNSNMIYHKNVFKYHNVPPEQQ
jgi:hypothetical protein